MWVSLGALDWFSAYLSNRSFSVSLGPYMLETAALSCGVPQGSVLGPILFALSMPPSFMLLSNFEINPITVMLTIFSSMSLFRPDNPDKLSVLHNYLILIKDWMSNNFLQLNTDKTVVLIIASDGIAPTIAHS